MRQIQKNENKGLLLIVISALGYGLIPIFSVKPLNNGIEVSTLLFMRFLLASVLLWTYIFIKKVPYKSTLKTLLYICTISLFGYSIASNANYTSYKYISPTLATLILFTHPVIVMFLERILRQIPITPKKIIAFIITLFGIFIVLYDQDAHYNSKGIMFAFLASFSYGIFCIGLAEKNVQKLNGIAVTAYVVTFTMIITGIQCVITDIPPIIINSTTIQSTIALTVFSTLIASVTFYEGLSIVGAGSATLISTVEPVFVAILSAIFLKEIFKFNFLLGGLITILGIIILEYKKPQEKNKKRAIS